MKQVFIKGETRLYLTKEQNVPESLIFDRQKYEIEKVSQDTYEQLAKLNNFRIVVSFSVLRNDTSVHCLYWFDETDLDALDRKVMAGLAEPNDFKFSIATHFGTTFCPKCLDRWRSLAGRSFYRFTNDFDGETVLIPHLVRYCPNCGTSFGQYPVFKLFNQLEDDDVYKHYRELIKQQRKQNQENQNDFPLDNE